MADLCLIQSELPNISVKINELGHKIPEISPIASKFQKVSDLLAKALELLESQQKSMELSQHTIENLNTELLNCLKEIKSAKINSNPTEQNIAEVYVQLDELISSLVSNLQSSPDQTADTSDHLDIIAQVTLATSEIEQQTEERIGNILIMSTSQNTLGSLERRLGAMGHQLTLCDSEEQMQQLLTVQPFDVLIFDAEASDDYGKAVLDFVMAREDHDYLPIIVMGSLKDTLLFNQSLESGADDFLAKPPNPALLKARIASALDKKEVHKIRQARLDELRANQESLEQSIADLPEGIAIFDRRGELVMYNNSYAQMYPHLSAMVPNGLKGVAFEQIIKANLRASIYDSPHASRQHIYTDLMRSFALPTASWKEQLVSGQTYEAVSYRTPDGGVVLTITDISKNLEDQERLEFMAFHDSLTGLANRVLFNKRLDSIIRAGHSTGLISAIVNMDLDGFKAVNDTYGHEAGDWVLIQVSQRLTRLLREKDTVARFGGDEFCILLEDMENKQQIASIVQRILDTIKRPYQREDGTVLDIGGSIGIAVFPGDGETADDLHAASDMAMYAVKRDGKGHFQFYSG